jgi:hypothetical protein
VRAAQPFVRLLVRVPEAYVLLGPFDATRPGLLVIDGFGRRVDVIDLARVADPAEIATRLKAAAKAPALERIRVTAEEPDALVKAMKGVAGVREVEADGRDVTVVAEADAAFPALLRAKVRFNDPVEVEEAPGAWHVASGRSYVPSVLIDPAWKIASLETRTIDLKGVGKGPKAAQVPFAALNVPGVVSAVPDFGKETLAIVARAGAVDWAAVEKAVAAAR